MGDRRSKLLAGLVAAALLAAGCGGSPDKAKLTGVATKQVAALSPSIMPRSVLGLTVAQENIGDALKTDDRTYLEAVSLFSLRRKKLVMATIQVGRLQDLAAYRKESFRQDLVYQLAGGAKPSKVVIDGTTVYLARGSKQSMAIWFQGVYELVMSIREDFDQPRALIRAAAGITL